MQYLKMMYTNFRGMKMMGVTFGSSQYHACDRPHSSCWRKDETEHAKKASVVIWKSCWDVSAQVSPQCWWKLFATDYRCG